jgi:hypothetical protein
MLFLTISSKNPLNMPVQHSHYANPREHRWPVLLSDQEQRLHRSLPFIGLVFCLGQLGDVVCGVAQGHQRLALGQRNGCVELRSPIHSLDQPQRQLTLATGVAVHKLFNR